MAENPYTTFFQQDSQTGSPVSVNPPTESPTVGAGNPYASFFNPQTSNASAAVPATPIQPQGENPYADYFGQKVNPISGHDESDRFTPDLGPDANWLEKATHFSNKPLTETLFGWGRYRSGAGGLERGTEKLLSDITAPLSLVTLAAFAPAGVAESVAGNVLKEGLTEGAEALGGEALNGIEAATKVENYAKAVQAAKRAQIAGSNIEDAVSSSSGLPYQEFQNYGKYLRDQGLKETDMLNQSLARRVASSGLQKAGLTPGKAVAVAKGIETGVNAGFAIQQLHGALYAYPRVMDLMSQGDYDDAMEYMVTGGAGAVFGALGVAGALHSSTDLIPGLNEKNNLELSDEAERFKKLFGNRDGLLGQSNVKINAEKRQNLASMLDLAGIEVPANLKVGSWKDVGIWDELKSAWNSVIVNKEQREKLADTQKAMFHLLDTGKDKVLLHQEAQALIYAYKLEDWAKDNLPDYQKPVRTLEDINTEERNNILAAKTNYEDSKGKLEEVESRISYLRDEIKNATSDNLAGISDALKQAIEARDDLKLKQPQLAEEYQKAKEWQNPTEETWKRHYDQLNDQLEKAWEPIDKSNPQNALDQFNQKVRHLGLNPYDMSLIEDKYPHFAKPPQAPNRIYPEPMTEQQSTALSGKIDTLQKQLSGLRDQFNTVADEREKNGPPDNFLEQLTPEEMRRVDNILSEEGYHGWYYDEKFNKLRFDPSDTPEWRQLSQKVGRLTSRLRELKFAHEKGIENYMGQVNKLPDGSKILYLPQESYQKLQSSIGLRKIPLGQSMPKSGVDVALAELEKSKNPDKDELIRLIKAARADDGGLVVSRDASYHANSLARRLHTIREELIHAWQGSLAASSHHRHLSPEQFQSLARKLPQGVIRHMNELGYSKDPATRVIEGAAKMMAVRDLNYLGVTPADAQRFLKEYFTVIKARHGDNAFNNLIHTTTFARRAKEDFLGTRRETGPEPSAGPEQTTGTVEGVGSGPGGGGTPPTPPEPPEPFDPSQGVGHAPAYPIAPWLDGPLHQALPDDIVSKVDKTRSKNWQPETVDYVKKQIQIMSDLASRQLTDKENAMYEALRKADDNNWTTGYNNGIIKSIVYNHVHHIWGEQENPVGNVVVQRANSGSFSINATQARHRTWATAFDGILQGRQLAVHDPVAIIAHDAHNIAKAAANRKLLLDLQASGIRDAEGMPVVVSYGRGYVVPGEDGTQSSILVNPNVVRNIMMGPEEISRLRNAGLLETYLKDGRVVDRTPQVHFGNVADWIESTQKKIAKMEEQNPLLHPTEIPRHEAAWGQLKLFAQEQARKIAEYLDRIIPEIKQKGPVEGKNYYEPVDISEKPDDISMVRYLNEVLHGQSTRKLGPADLKRLQDYAERNHKYADGLSAYGNGDAPIRPHEVAGLIRQEIEHFKDPELKDYLNEVNERVQGGWDQKGLNKSLYHVAHAAENTKYPQLHKDLSDLKWVDNVLKSPDSLIRPWRETGPQPTLSPQTLEQNKAEAEARLKDINERQEKQYLWAPKTHIVVDHPAFHGWKWMATAADGTPTLAESELGVSKYYYNYLVNRLGLEPSWLRKPEGFGKITAPLLNVGAKAKATLLSGSPFHVVQEGLRAFMLWMNPFVRPNPIEDLDELVQTPKGMLPLLRLGVRNGLTVFDSRHAAEDYSVGVAGHLPEIGEDNFLNKVPIVNKTLVPAANTYIRVADAIHDFLFNRLIPSYKASGFKKMFNKYAEAHPDWSEDAIAHAAAKHVNDTFGGQNWREMGRSAATQDWFHLVALAPDWLESEMRFAAGLFRGLGVGPAKYEPEYGKTFTRQQVAGTAAALWTIARVVNMVYSGSPHYETPFGLATKDKDGREIEVSVRTMPTDILHMASDPVGFMKGRLSPFVRTAQEEYTGRNEYGQKLTDSEKYVDLVSNLVPIWGQAGIKQATHLATSADVPTTFQVIKAAGGTAQVYRTPAQKTAANLASERSEEGTMNPAKIAHHRLILQLEDDVRNGKLHADDLSHMVDYGNLPLADAKAVMKNVKETAGEDPETARLFSRVSRLDFQGAVQVWDDANPSEKQMLEKLIVKKAKSYMSKARTTLTPQEREKDPLFKRARRIAPAIEPEQ